MVHLMNSAMMPQAGKYSLKAIMPAEFGERVRQAEGEGILKSYIGYPQNLEVIKALCNVRVKLSREKTEIESGDVLLIMRLSYRPGRDLQKGAKVKVSDFEYFICQYER